MSSRRIQDVRVKVGAGSTYDSGTGAMAQGTSSTELKVTFVSLESGGIVWKNGSVVRYEPTNKKFETAAKMLYDL